MFKSNKAGPVVRCALCVPLMLKRDSWSFCPPPAAPPNNAGSKGCLCRTLGWFEVEYKERAQCAAYECQQGSLHVCTDWIFQFPPGLNRMKEDVKLSRVCVSCEAAVTSLRCSPTFDPVTAAHVVTVPCVCAMFKDPHRRPSLQMCPSRL